MSVAVELSGVGYRFGRRVALSDVDLSVGGGVLGVLGPNGAGKSTLLSLVATLLRPQSGRVSVLGHDVTTVAGRAAARRGLGLLPQRFTLVPSLSVIDTVAYAAWVNGVSSASCLPRAKEALAAVGLSDLTTAKVRTLSGGQRQRLGIAAAIAHTPPLLLLDEPTVGLDPAARVQLRRHVRDLARHCSVVLSTHLVEDVTQLCERIVVLNEGRVVFDGSNTALIDSFDEPAAELASPLEAAYERLLTQRPPE